jgi:hypothetical protein
MTRLAPQPERVPSVLRQPGRHDLDGGELRGNSRAKAGATRPMTNKVLRSMPTLGRVVRL